MIMMIIIIKKDENSPSTDSYCLSTNCLYKWTKSNILRRRCNDNLTPSSTKNPKNIRGYKNKLKENHILDLEREQKLKGIKSFALMII